MRWYEQELGTVLLSSGNISQLLAFGTWAGTPAARGWWLGPASTGSPKAPSTSATTIWSPANCGYSSRELSLWPELGAQVPSVRAGSSAWPFLDRACPSSGPGGAGPGTKSARCVHRGQWPGTIVL